MSSPLSSSLSLSSACSVNHYNDDDNVQFDQFTTRVSMPLFPCSQPIKIDQQKTSLEYAQEYVGLYPHLIGIYVDAMHDIDFDRINTHLYNDYDMDAFSEFDSLE